jgi:hypothetical protein
VALEEEAARAKAVSAGAEGTLDASVMGSLEFPGKYAGDGVASTSTNSMKSSCWFYPPIPGTVAPLI